MFSPYFLPSIDSTNVLPTALLWQTHALKFTLSSPHREAWATLHATLRGVTRHPACPALVATGFDALAAALRRQVKSPDDVQREAAQRDGGGGGGAAPQGVAGMAAAALDRARQSCSVQ